MAQSAGTITREETDTKGRYVYRLADHPDAEMAFPKAGASLIIDHFAVPDAYRGKGVGITLVARDVDDARAQGKKIRRFAPSRRHNSSGTPNGRTCCQND